MLLDFEITPALAVRSIKPEVIGASNELPAPRLHGSGSGLPAVGPIPVARRWPATDGTFSADYTQWVPTPYYEQSIYPLRSIVQAHGHATAAHGDDIISSLGTLPLEPPANDMFPPSHQLILTNSTTEPNTQSMAPPLNARKRKARTLRQDDWEPVKDRLIDLHINQKRPLPEAKQIVEEEFKHVGFTATIRQYRSRLSQWGFNKNVKPGEMAVIVKKKQRRKLIETNKRELNFRIRGSEVATEKIDRWMRKNGISEDIVYAPSPTAAYTPAALSAWTASEHCSPAFNSDISSPVASPSSLSLLDGNSFTGQSPRPSYRSFSALQVPSGHSTQPWPVNSQATMKQYRYRGDEEEQAMQELSAREALWGEGHQETLGALETLGDILLTQGRYRSAEERFRPLLAYCRAQYGEEHSKTLSALDGLGQVFQRQGLYKKAKKLHQKTFNGRKTLLGEEHRDTLGSMGSLVSTFLHQGRWKEAEGLSIQVNRDKQESAWRGPSLHADQYGQSGVDILETRPMARGGGARGASNGDKQEGTWRGASRHAEQYGQPCRHVESTRS